MRIHSNIITAAHIFEAEKIARVSTDRCSQHGSRSHTRAYDIILSGESRRRQNGGENYAATWDQWGVFLAELFKVDPNMVTPYYADFDAFDMATSGRFAGGWPDDAHGDHTFRFQGVPCQQSCTKCSATQRWS